MSKIEECMKIKKFIDYHEKLQWTNRTYDVRIFTKGCPSSEVTVSEVIKNVIREAFNEQPEYYGSSISYYASHFMGEALKKAVLKYMRNKLKKLSEEAKEEAEYVLKQVESGK